MRRQPVIWGSAPPKKEFSMDDDKFNNENDEDLGATGAEDAEETTDAADENTSPTSGDAIAQELLPVSVESEMRRSYLDYAMSVIVGRALPDVRDGLKPVHRRVLYAMKEIGNTHSAPTKKSARVVGEVLGKYHPHGDRAVYQTIVRMAQDFSLRYPLIEGQGNFGSIDGDNAAAMRYTEVRMEKIAAHMLADINEDTVDFVPNFDNSEQEPVVLPTRLPQLLINGSSGIAVGMATNIPPHNLRETIAACLHCLHNPDCTIDSLIERMPAPDFPTGGIIFGMAGVRQGYHTGRGRVIMRARTHLEDFGNGRTRIVIDEIPYMVNKRSLYERMHELWRDKKLEGISEMRDESTRQIRIAIDLKMGTMPEVVLNNLYKMTQMQESFGINMVALVDGQPMLLNLKQMIEYFLAHRREVVTRRTVFRLHRVRQLAHYLEGQAIALANLDEFIRIIRGSRTPEEAAEALYGRGWDLGFAREITARAQGFEKDFYPEDMDRSRGLRKDGLYWLTRPQVDNILAMNLRRLTGLEQEKILSDFRTRVDELMDYLDILAKPERVTAIIGEELEAIGNEFGDERRSTIDLLGDPSFNQRDLIPRRDMVVTISKGGFIKMQELADYAAQGRGGKGRNVQSMTKDDEVEHLFVANTHDILLCFSSMGRIFALDVFDLPEGKSSARGRPIVNLLSLDEGERITFTQPITEFAEKGDDSQIVILATANGYVKRTPLSAYRNARPGTGLRAMTLVEGDSLVSVSVTDGSGDLFVVSSAGRALRFPQSSVRVMGRTAKGVRSMRLPAGARVLNCTPITDESAKILVAPENGYGKRVELSEFTPHGRGTMGQMLIRCSARNGAVAAAELVGETEDVIMLCNRGRMIRTRIAEIGVYGRGAHGVRLFRLDDELLVSMRIVPPSDDAEIEHLEIEEPEDEDEVLEDDVDDLDETEALEDEADDAEETEDDSAE